MATPQSDYEDSGKRMVAYGATAFAGVMLATVGVFQILEGISAIAKDDIYVSGINYSYKLSVTSWGWIHLLVGAIAVAVAIGILMGQTWGRVAGIAIAGLSALTNFAFLPYTPVWTLVIIAFDAFIIWALCVQLSHNDRW